MKHKNSRSQSREPPPREPYQLQAANQVKLVPDRSTDRLRIISKKPSSASSADICHTDIYDSQNRLIAQGFVRSKQSQQNLQEEAENARLSVVREEKNALNRRLNESLLDLDRLNEEKRKIHDKLIDQMTFVRDLNKACGGDANGLFVSEELRFAYKQEKILHHSLESQIRQVQEETSCLVSKIKKVNSLRQLNISNTHSNSDTIQVCTGSARRLCQQLDLMEEQCRNAEEAIQLWAEKVYSDPELLARERAIAVLTQEIQMLRQKTIELEQRDEQALRAFGDQQGRISRMRQNALKYLSAKYLSKTLYKAVQRIQMESLRGICTASRELFERTQHLEGLSRTIKCKQRHLQHICQQETLEQSRLKIRGPPRRLAAHIKSVQRISSVWQQRLLERGFRRWRQSKNTTALLKQIIQRRIRLQNISTHKAFLIWLFATVESEQVSQVSTLPIVTSQTSLRMAVFRSLQANAVEARVRRRSLLMRALKNLKVNREQRRLKKAVTKMAQIVSMEEEQKLKSAAFQLLRHLKEKSILELAENTLSRTNKLTNALAMECRQLQSAKDKNSLGRALYALCVSPGRKFLTQVLCRWRHCVVHEKKQVRFLIKRLLLKTYKNKLRNGFARLAASEAGLLQAQDQSQICSIHELNAVVSAQNKTLGVQICQEQCRVRALAARHLRTLVFRAFLRNLEHWLRKWGRAAKLQRDQQEALDLIVIKKLRVCMLRQVFQKYQRGVKFFNQDRFNIRRSNEVRFRLVTRSKARIFQALHEYAKLSKDRTRAMYFLKQTIDRHINTRYLLKWRRFSLQNREMHLLAREKKHVSELDVLQENLSFVSDRLNRQSLDNKKLSRQLTNQCKRILQKWLERNAMCSMRFGLITWGQKVRNLKARNWLTFYLKNHDKQQQLQLAMQRWKAASSKILMQHSEEYKEKVARQIDQELQNLQHQREVVQRENDKLVLAALNPGFKIEELTDVERAVLLPPRPGAAAPPNPSRSFSPETKLLREAAAEADVKFRKLMGGATRKRQEFDFCCKERFVTEKWRDHNTRYRQMARALERGVTKLALQNAFNEIRDSVREEDLLARKQKVARKWVLRRYRQATLQAFFSHWRYQVFGVELKELADLRTQLRREVQEQDLFRARVKTIHSILSNERSYAKAMQAMWDTWHSYAFDMAVKKRETTEFDQLVSCYQIKRALYKLKQCSEKAKKQRAQVAKSRQMSRMITMWACFRNLRHFKNSQQQFRHRVCSLAAKINNSQKLIAFKRILYRSQISTANCRRDQQMSCFMLHQATTKKRSQIMRQAFSSIKSRSEMLKKLYTCIVQHFMSKSSWNKRARFQHWRYQAQKETVVIENEQQDGETNVLCFQMRLQCNSLAEMMQRDGCSDSHITQLLSLQKQKFTQLADKTITRLMIHRDQDYLLLPHCLDRLRSHARALKKWKRVLQFCNGMVRQDHNMLFSIFRRWRDQGWQQKEVLHARPFRELLLRADQNLHVIQQKADCIEQKADSIDLFEQQREDLVEKYADSLRIGVLIGKQNHEKSAMKAVGKLSDFSRKGLKKDIEFTLSQNMYMIQKLKHDIHVLEHKNSEIASDSDQLRIKKQVAERSRIMYSQLQSEIATMKRRQQDLATQQKELIRENYNITVLMKMKAQDFHKTIEDSSRIQHQKMQDLERLRLEERQSRGRLFSSQKDVLPLLREASEPTIVTNTSHEMGRSPLRTQIMPYTPNRTPSVYAKTPTNP